MNKIERATVTIKGKEYAFLKPTAVDMIEIEDKHLRNGADIDSIAYNTDLLALVTRDVKVDDLVEFKSQRIEMSSGDVITIPEIGYSKWIGEIKEVGEFSRVKLAKKAVSASGVSGEINLKGFTYDDIDGLAMAFFSLYDSSELNAVIEEISTFCV